MSGRRPRRDELELWQAVAKTTSAYHPERGLARRTTPGPQPAEADDAGQPGRSPGIGPFAVGAAGGQGGRHDVLPGLAERLATAPLRMDRKAFERLKRGKLRPEARLDLHGMTLDQARPALTAFLMSSHARSRRLVLVITGKGRNDDDVGPIPARPGALRHNVPLWLHQAPLAQIVQQVTRAHGRHGGDGALYVYLRRKR